MQEIVVLKRINAFDCPNELSLNAVLDKTEGYPDGKYFNHSDAGLRYG